MQSSDNFIFLKLNTFQHIQNTAEYVIMCVNVDGREKERLFGMLDDDVPQ